MENNLIKSINNLRMNPILFYEKNFREFKNICWIKKYLEEKENEKINIIGNILKSMIIIII